MAAETGRAAEEEAPHRHWLTVVEDVSVATQRLAQRISGVTEPMRRFGQALRCIYWLVVVSMMVLEAERYARLSLPPAPRNVDEPS